MGLLAEDGIGFLMNKREENELGQVHERRLGESVVFLCACEKQVRKMEISQILHWCTNPLRKTPSPSLWTAWIRCKLLIATKRHSCLAISLQEKKMDASAPLTVPTVNHHSQPKRQTTAQVETLGHSHVRSNGRL